MDKETKQGKGEQKFAAAAAAAAADVILEAMIDGVAVADINGSIIQCNTAYAKMFGFESGSKAVGSTFMEVHAEREIPRAMAEFEKSFKTGGAINVEFIGKDRSGREFPIMVNATTLKDEKGHIVGSVGVLRDITESKRAEEREKELVVAAKAAAIIEAMIDGVGIADLELRVMDVNKALLKMFGFEKKEEMIGKYVTDLFPESEGAILMGRAREDIEKGISRVSTYTTIDKAGRKFPVQISVSLRKDEKGKPIEFISVLRDITELKRAEEALRESEEKFRSVIDNVGIGIVLTSPNMEVLFINNQMQRWFPNVDASKKPICYKSFNIPPIDDLCPHCVTWKALKDGKTYETVVNTPQDRDYRIISSPIKDSYGRVVAAVEIVEDITERKLMQEKLLTSERLAVMGRLVADITHEIKNPLTIILSGTQFALSQLDKKSSPFKKQLKTVLRGAQRCKAIIDNLLGYNRTIGKKEESINLPAIIRDAIQDVNYQYDMSGIETVLNCNEITNAEIAGNSTALLSVFVNLIRNARQAMGEKGRLTINMEKEDKRHLRIQIHDTGSGISDKQMAELFKPFASGWKEKEGSGLGLATSLGIIETHGGSMSAESEGVGRGATFTILLPCEFKDKK